MSNEALSDLDSIPVDLGLNGVVLDTNNLGAEVLDVGGVFDTNVPVPKLVICEGCDVGGVLGMKTLDMDLPGTGALNSRPLDIAESKIELLLGKEFELLRKVVAMAEEKGVTDILKLFKDEALDKGAFEGTASREEVVERLEEDSKGFAVMLPK